MDDPKKTVVMIHPDGGEWDIPVERAKEAQEAGYTLKEEPLSWGQAIKGTAQNTLSGLLIGGGALAGGMAGSTVAPIAGTAAGGVLGAGAGSSLDNVLRQNFPSVFGPAAENPLTKIATDAAFGVTEGVGPMISAARIPKNMNALREIALLDEVSPSKVAIPHSLGDVMPESYLGMENFSRGSIFTGKKWMPFDKAKGKAMFEWREKLLNWIGPRIEKEALGERVFAAVNKGAKTWEQVFDTMYDDLDQLYKIPVDPQKIRMLGRDMKRELDDMMKLTPGIFSKESLAKYQGLIGTLENYAVGQATTYRDLNNLRKLAGKFIRTLEPTDPTRTEAKAAIERIYGTVAEVMDDAARHFDPTQAAEVKQINAAYTRYKDLFERASVVADIRGDLPQNAGKYVDQLFRPGEITPMKDVVEALTPEARKELLPAIRRRAVENIFASISKGTNFEEMKLSGEALFKKLSTPDVLDNLKSYLSQEQIDAIRKLAHAAMGSGLINPMSGRQSKALAEINGVVQIALGGLAAVTGNPMIGATMVGTGTMTSIAPSVWARLALNPKVAKFLAKGFFISPAIAQATGWTARAANMIRIASEAPETDFSNLPDLSQEQSQFNDVKLPQFAVNAARGAMQ